MVDITLSKEKYRLPGRLLHRTNVDPPFGTWTFNAGRFTRKTSNSGISQKAKQGWGIRRRSYFTHISA